MEVRKESNGLKNSIVTREELAIINQFTKRALKEDEVYTFAVRLLLETVHFCRFCQNFKRQSDKPKQDKRFFLIGFIISVAGIQIGKREGQILSQNAKCAPCILFSGVLLLRLFLWYGNFVCMHG